jgi:hypothetical protein
MAGGVDCRINDLDALPVRQEPTSNQREDHQMRKLMLTTTALLGLTAGSASAYLDAEEIVAYFADLNPSKIEIERGLGMTKVEVTTTTGKIEVVFDDETNAELYREEKDSAGNKILEIGDSSFDDAFDDDDDEDDDDDDDDDEDEDDDDDEGDDD